jgi:thiol-disulfide isomerase/thioredoxin
MDTIYLFSKESCGPCRLVDKYISSLDDERSKSIKKVDLEDVSENPIPEENLNLAKIYGVTATPVLIVSSENGLKIKEYIGGVQITQNIKEVFDKHA